MQRAFSPADFAAAEDVVIPGPEFRGRGGVAAVAALAAELPRAQGPGANAILLSTHPR